MGGGGRLAGSALTPARSVRFGVNCTTPSWCWRVGELLGVGEEAHASGIGTLSLSKGKRSVLFPGSGRGALSNYQATQREADSH